MLVLTFFNLFEDFSQTPGNNSDRSWYSGLALFAIHRIFWFKGFFPLIGPNKIERFSWSQSAHCQQNIVVSFHGCNNIRSEIFKIISWSRALLKDLVELCCYKILYFRLRQIDLGLFIFNFALLDNVLLWDHSRKSHSVLDIKYHSELAFTYLFNFKCELWGSRFVHPIF